MKRFTVSGESEIEKDLERVRKFLKRV